MNPPNDNASLSSSLRLGAGFRPEERHSIEEQLASLDSRLRSFRADAADLELSVKERDQPSQRTVLAADLAGWPRFVATSTHTELSQALTEVRDDLIRQITDAKDRTEPRNNRRRRETEV